MQRLHDNGLLLTQCSEHSAGHTCKRHDYVAAPGPREFACQTLLGMCVSKQQCMGRRSYMGVVLALDTCVLGLVGRLPPGGKGGGGASINANMELEASRLQPGNGRRRCCTPFCINSRSAANTRLACLVGYLSKLEKDVQAMRPLGSSGLHMTEPYGTMHGKEQGSAAHPSCN